jgi:site-specific recombinase XerD
MSYLNTRKASREAATLPVRGLALAYLAASRGSRNPASQRLTRHRLLVFADWCEVQGIGAEQCDARIVADFVTHLEATHPGRKRGSAQISKATLAGFVQCIKAMLAWAVEDELFYSSYLDEKSVKKIARVKQDDIIVDTLDDSHVRALLSACKAEENEYMRARARTMIHVLYGSGLRASELCNLRLQHCCLDAGAAFLMIRLAKGRKDRKVPIAETCRRKLEDWVLTWRADATPTAPVFLNRDSSSQLTVAGLQQLLKRLARRAGITDRRVSPHNFRHSYAANFIRNGGDIYTLQRLLGHSTPVQTQQYIKSLGCDFDLHDRALPYLR